MQAQGARRGCLRTVLWFALTGCAGWRGRALFWAVREDTDGPIRPAAIWPPVDAPGFLMLQELGPVPASIRALLD